MPAMRALVAPVAQTAPAQSTIVATIFRSSGVGIVAGAGAWPVSARAWTAP